MSVAGVSSSSRGTELSNRLLVVAPHPDDEVLGCGGTILRRKSEGAELGWLIVTGISEESGWAIERIKRRDAEIEAVSKLLGFTHVFNLRFPTTALDTLPMGEMISRFAEVFQKFQPQEVLIPHRGDVHSDHRLVADAVTACTKWFRYPSVKRVMAYETSSETEFGLARESAFQPNFFVDISAHLEEKLAAMSIYQSELGDFPFPRSIRAIRALAEWRGSSAGYLAAEAFELLRERQ
jgi:LmbE family N-acetylglucosaminyl deacetylase